MHLSRLRDYTMAARSLATGAVVGRGNEQVRLLPLQAPPTAPSGVEDLVAGRCIAEVQAHLASGLITSEALTGYLLAKTGADDLHTLISLNPDALREAGEADRRRAGGESGPLLGIPVTIKDNIETAGPMPTTGGAEILLEHHPGQDAPLVAALRQAGAVILGKSNLSELAGAVARSPGFSAVGGQTQSPAGARFSPGGSSSGSAAGVAAGLTLGSIGTETSGSLIAPAAFCGVVALKPTAGLMSTDGVIPLLGQQDAPGPVAGCVADVAALFEAMSGQSAQLSDAAPQDVRVGLLSRDIAAQTRGLEDTSDATDLRDRIAARLLASGAVVVDVEITGRGAAGFSADLMQLLLGGLAHETIAYLRDAGAPVRTLADLQAYNLARPRRRMPAGQAVLSMAVIAGVSRTEYEAVRLTRRDEARATIGAAFASARADLLVSVSNIHSALYATAGCPAVSIPAGLRRNGMPTGITLIGPGGSDAWLLEMASALEVTR